MENSYSIDIIYQHIHIILILELVYMCCYCIGHRYATTKLFPLIYLIILTLLHQTNIINKTIYVLVYIFALAGDYYLMGVNPNNNNNNESYYTILGTIYFRWMFISLQIILISLIKTNSIISLICTYIILFTDIFILNINLYCIITNLFFINKHTYVRFYICSILLFVLTNMISIDKNYNNIVLSLNDNLTCFYLGTLFMVISDSLFGIFYLGLKLVNAYTRSLVILTYWTSMILYFLSIPN